MSTKLKNRLYLVRYILELVIHQVRLSLFRLYLFVVFALRLGGAIMIGAATAGAFYALQTLEHGLLSILPDQVKAYLIGVRHDILSTEIVASLYDPAATYGTEMIAALIGIGVFLAVRIATRFIAPVFYSFPMPRRPMPPVLRWEPPEHVIEAVPAAIATPPRGPDCWDGDWLTIERRLKPELQALLDRPGPGAPV